MRNFLIATVLIVSLASHAGGKQEIRFKRGESSTEISGAVIRGERDQYVLVAGKDQYLAVTMTSIESNAVLNIYGPGYKFDADGEVIGVRLKGASEVTRYVGQLPAKGQYLIVVGGTRGNANYKISMGITTEVPPTPVAQKTLATGAPDPTVAQQLLRPVPNQPATNAVPPTSLICVQDVRADFKLGSWFLFDGKYVGRFYVPTQDGNALWVFSNWQIGTWQRQGNAIELSMFARQDDLKKGREYILNSAQALKLARNDPARAILDERARVLLEQIKTEPTILRQEKMTKLTMSLPRQTEYEGWVDEEGSRVNVTCGPIEQSQQQFFVSKLRLYLSRLQ